MYLINGADLCFVHIPNKFVLFAGRMSVRIKTWRRGWSKSRADKHLPG